MVGVAGAAGCAVALVFLPAQFFRSYLVAYTFWVGVGSGSLVILMVQHLTAGVWGILIRRVLEAGTRTLPLLAVLFVPIALGLRDLYPWARPDEVAHAEALQHKQAYLNIPFFLVRAAVCFVAWLVVAFFLNRWSAEDDARPNAASSRRFQLLSGGGLVVYGITITFASIDWVMSIEPNWASTIYPVMYATGQVLTAFAFALAMLMLLAARPPFPGIIAPQHMRDLGNLLLAFIMLWAYMSISQFLLIWSGNLPEEIPWYLRRGRGGWEWVSIALFLIHFAVPFLLLLSRSVKQNGPFLLAVAAGVLIMRFIDVLWWIEPAYGGENSASSLFWLVDVIAFLSVGGFWMSWFLWQLQKRPLLPRHPELASGE
jgi:hypothetical protein